MPSGASDTSTREPRHQETRRTPIPRLRSRDTRRPRWFRGHHPWNLGAKNPEGPQTPRLQEDNPLRPQEPRAPRLQRASAPKRSFEHPAPRAGEPSVPQTSELSSSSPGTSRATLRRALAPKNLRSRAPPFPSASTTESFDSEEPPLPNASVPENISSRELRLRRTATLENDDRSTPRPSARAT